MYTFIPYFVLTNGECIVETIGGTLTLIKVQPFLILLKQG